MRIKTPLAIDRTIELHINGSIQQLRICAARVGLPPLLVVQAGPGLPLLHEVRKFQRLLNLEQNYLVAYWEQRGCGDAPRSDAEGASWPQQVDDLCTVLAWLQRETKQRIVVVGISLGGTITLRAAEREPDRVRAVIAVSPDLHTADSDAGAGAFLQEQVHRAGNRRLARRVAK